MKFCILCKLGLTSSCGINAEIIVQLEDVGSCPHKLIVHAALSDIRQTRPNGFSAVLDHHLPFLLGHLTDGPPPMDLALACKLHSVTTYKKVGLSPDLCSKQSQKPRQHILAS